MKANHEKHKAAFHARSIAPVLGRYCYHNYFYKYSNEEKKSPDTL